MVHLSHTVDSADLSFSRGRVWCGSSWFSSPVCHHRSSRDTCVPVMSTIFDDVAKEFGWEDAVAKWLVDPKGFGAQKVEDFLHVAAEESGPEFRQIAEEVNATMKLQQTSRLRQAWKALRTTAKASGSTSWLDPHVRFHRGSVDGGLHDVGSDLPVLVLAQLGESIGSLPVGA